MRHVTSACRRSRHRSLPRARRAGRRCRKLECRGPPDRASRARALSRRRRRSRMARSRAQGSYGFQRALGLSPTGHVGPATRSRVRLARAAAPRTARARHRCGRLGRLRARVPSDVLRPPPRSGRRSLHGGDGEGAYTLPGQAVVWSPTASPESRRTAPSWARRVPPPRSRLRSLRRTSSSPVRTSPRSPLDITRVRSVSRRRTGWTSARRSSRAGDSRFRPAR